MYVTVTRMIVIDGRQADIAAARLRGLDEVGLVAECRDDGRDGLADHFAVRLAKRQHGEVVIAGGHHA